MGREIRRVPPNWKHPMYGLPEDDTAMADMPYALARMGTPIPLFDQDYEAARAEWNGDPDEEPDPTSHRPAFTEEATWFQMYETVTEGTPVTPPFETKAELIDWLVDKGEAHGTRHERRYTRAQAEAFVEAEWAPSLVFTPQHGLQSGVEACGNKRGGK